MKGSENDSVARSRSKSSERRHEASKTGTNAWRVGSGWAGTGYMCSRHLISDSSMGTSHRDTELQVCLVSSSTRSAPCSLGKSMRLPSRLLAFSLTIADQLHEAQQECWTGLGNTRTLTTISTVAHVPYASTMACGVLWRAVKGMSRWCRNYA